MKGDRTPGRRLPDQRGPPLGLEPGDYAWNAATGRWWVSTPNGIVGPIYEPEWTVTLHEDRTISVFPSIDADGGDGLRWHGWLKRGNWEEA